MKLSLKFHNTNENQQTQIMTAKLPITIFNNPLLSTITATGNSSSDFSFSLSTNFPTGPTFKLSYTPTTTQTSSLPFSLSLKSGLGLSGSTHHSPLVFSANLSLSTPSSSTPLLLPSFSLHFKPQFGHFSLHKTVLSDSNSNPNPNTNTNTKTVSDSNPLSVLPQIGKGFVPFQDGCSSGWQNLNLEPYGHREDDDNNNNVVAGSVVPDGKNSEKYGLSPCVAVMARTILPVTQGLLLKFRWGVNFPGNKSGLKIPYLTVNKIGLERMDEMKRDELKSENREGDLQMVKDVCLWAKGDLEKVEKENKEMKRVLDEMKMRVSSGEGKLSNPKKHLSGEGFQTQTQTRGNNNNNIDRKKNEKKQSNMAQNVVVVSDLESELEKAIKAAAAAAASS